MAYNVLITGGSRGIGAAAVREFAKAGYNVAFTWHSSVSAADAVVQDVRSACPDCRVVSIQADAGDAAQVRAAVSKAEYELGSLQVLVCNAGIAQQKLFSDITEADWDTMFDVNTKGVYRVIQAVLPQLLERQAGSIVTVSSIWGQTGGSCEVHYSASKAAVAGMTKALAKEVSPSGITVNCIAPGVIHTPMLDCFSQEELGQLVEQTPIGRLGRGEDVAALALFLASEQAEFITGQVICADGGFAL